MVAYFTALMVVKMSQLKASEMVVYLAHRWTVLPKAAYLAVLTVVTRAPQKPSKTAAYLADLTVAMMDASSLR